VVGEASDEASAVAAVKELRPGVVLLPGRDGFAIAVELRALDPELAIVLTSSRPADEWGARLAAPPVDGFVHKDDLSASALTQVLG
jgi:DNA-binding NarL/FixJ family response regulator